MCVVSCDCVRTVAHGFMEKAGHVDIDVVIWLRICVLKRLRILLPEGDAIHVMDELHLGTHLNQVLKPGIPMASKGRDPQNATEIDKKHAAMDATNARTATYAIQCTNLGWPYDSWRLSSSHLPLHLMHWSCYELDNYPLYSSTIMWSIRKHYTTAVSLLHSLITENTR